MELNEQMKELLRDLGFALNHALTEDSQIKSITNQIKRNGYDIYLIMEANIALDPRNGKTEGQLIRRTPEDHLELEEMAFNSYDQRFLASMQIKADDF